MKKEIDFLKAYEKKTEPARNIFQFLSKGLIGIMVIYCFLLAGIIFYWSILNREFKKVNSQVELKKTRIKQQEKKESLYFLLKNQLSFLPKIIPSGEENYSQIFSSISQIAEEKAKISEIKISSTGETQISGTAVNAFNFDKFLEEVINSEKIRIFSKIILNSISKTKEGNYIFSMTFSYDKN